MVDEMALIIMRTALLGRGQGRAGLLDGVLRPQRADGRPGPDDLDAPRLVPGRGRVDPARSTAAASTRATSFIMNDPYGSGGIHLPDIYVIKPVFVGDDARSVRLHGRAPHRRRRDRAGQQRQHGDGDLPGGAAAADAQAVRARRPLRGDLRDHREQRPGAEEGARRPAGADRGGQHRRARLPGPGRALRRRPAVRRTPTPCSTTASGWRATRSRALPNGLLPLHRLHRPRQRRSGPGRLPGGRDRRGRPPDRGLRGDVLSSKGRDQLAAAVHEVGGLRGGAAGDGPVDPDLGRLLPDSRGARR